MPFRSILYEGGARRALQAPREAPEYFRDLNLDQLVEAITAGKEDYDLKPFFHDHLTTPETVRYRHDIMRDLEAGHTLGHIKAFAEHMRLMRSQIAQASKLYYQYHKERWFLHAVETYCAAVPTLSADLSRADLHSRGLLGFRDWLADYVASDRFTALSGAVTALVADLAQVRYCILVKDDGFKVRKYHSEVDYGEEVTDTFRKFQQGAVKDYRAQFRESTDMNHIEAQVLDFVARLYPEVFARLDGFCADNRDYADPTIVNFDREIQFYVAYLEHMNRLRTLGLCFCYPEVSPDDKDIHDAAGFDLALATKLLVTRTPVVCNDVFVTGHERILVVSGPNQGGKTTLARTFGQLHHLAGIGCPVPGTDARLFLFDDMFVHFERQEDIRNLHGKLQDDLIRIHATLQRATPRSIVIMNEIFSSTTLQDAVFLARRVISRLIELDCLCVCVTFLDELASLSEKTVSMVSTVVADNPSVRTFKVVRRPADGQAYAISVAEKYRLTYAQLKQRLPGEARGNPAPTPPSQPASQP